MKESSRALPQMDKNNDLKISIEELTAYAEIKIAEYADQKGVNRMTPVYMADGDVEYSHFNLFSYKKDEKANEVENRKSELDIAAEAMSEIEAEAANRPKTEIDNSYLDEKLPVFTYKSDDEEVIDYSKMKNTKIENWREVYAKQQELERKRKDEEERKRKEEEKRKYEEAKEKYSSEMRQWYQTELQKCQNEQDIQRKLDALNKMQEKIKASSAFPEISSQYPNMLAPYIQSAEEAKIEMEATIKKREGDFKAELGSMEKMVKSKLRQNIQQKYLEAFKNKWLDYAGKIQSRGLVKRFNKLLALNIALPKIKHGVTDEIDLGGGVKLEMVFIEGRNFNMGSNNGSDDEKPVHRVTLDDFYIGKYEVTQEQWEAVMGENHSEFKGNNLPVEQVSWEDCQEFIEKINEITGMKLRLPTEAEWEYAAKGGQEYEYSGSDDLDEVGWYSSNSGNRTNSVGQKRSNGYGLYDMSGNVCEWCQDWYQEDYYSNSLTDNPNGPQFGSGRVLRGGGWYDGGDDYCRVASRDGNGPSYRGSNYGFRLVSAVRLD
ncbi:formylglycine-generating enzyme family protein [Candidatus Dependentiae bacterium]|nr:formylglycine-generating enzyme family protein [Candidatus Dependentiae bacterium]